MKNLKKVLALVVVFTMVLSTVAFAGYPDVDANADYAGAVELLSALDILKGDDTGNFNPDQNITRAEFAAVVCRALGLEASANGAKGTTVFTDVPADHWASGYINLASQQEIINGMGDGTFEPESNVTYTQAVKMLVVALGYEPMAEKKGGYPAGYLATANSINLTEGVPSTASDTPALRSTVAMLTANAMELPTMEQHTYGTDSLYGINDGKATNGYVYDFKSLLTAMDIYIATGTVRPMTDDTKQTITIDITQDNPDGVFNYRDADGKVLAAKYLEYDFYVNGSNILDYVNEKVNVYVEKINSRYHIVAVVPSEEGDVFEIDAALIEKAEIANIGKDKFVKYYETADSTTTSKIYVETTDADALNTAVYVNGVSYGTDFDGALKAVANKDAAVKFIENTNNRYYDVIEITSFDYYTVAEVDAAKNKIKLTANGKDKTVAFEDVEDDASYSIAFVDADGAEISLADFAEDDVVAVVSSKLGNPKPDDDNKNITYMNLGDSTVTGSVSGLNAEEKVIYIDGTKYDVIGQTVNSDKGFKLGDEGTYFITLSGKLFAFDGSKAANYKYAYILHAAKVSAGVDAGSVQFKLLTADQGIVVVDAYSTFDVTDEKENKKSYKTETDADAIVAIYKKGGSATDADRLVKYKLNSSNYLRSIAEFDDVANVNDSYNKDLGAADGKYFDETVVIFAVDGNDADKSFVANLSALVDENTYTGIVADAGNEDLYSVAKFDIANFGGVDKAQGIAIVNAKSYTTYNGEEAVMVEVFSDNDVEAKTIYFNDEDSDNDGKIAYTALNVGSAILYTADENGLVSNYIVLGTMKNNVFEPSKEGVAAASGESGKVDYAYAWGYVKDEKNGMMEIFGGVNNDTYRVRGNMYAHQALTKGAKIYVEDYATKNFDDFDAEKKTANFIFIKLADGKVTDMYACDKRVDVSAILSSADEVVEVVEEVVDTTVDAIVYED